MGGGVGVGLDLALASQPGLTDGPTACKKGGGWDFGSYVVTLAWGEVAKGREGVRQSASPFLLAGDQLLVLQQRVSQFYAARS